MVCSCVGRLEWKSFWPIRGVWPRERMFRLLRSGALPAGPSGFPLKIGICFACFLPTLQASSTFHEGEQACMEAFTREEGRAL